MNRLKQYDTILCENKAQWEHIKKHVRLHRILHRIHDENDIFENYPAMYWGRNCLKLVPRATYRACCNGQPLYQMSFEAFCNKAGIVQLNYIKPIHFIKEHKII